MTINPYTDSDIANRLWEAEMVADKYYQGGIILIRAKIGWRAFFGTLKEDYLHTLEAALDKNVPSYEKTIAISFNNGEIERNSSLSKEIMQLLIDIGAFTFNYSPMKFVYGLEDDEKR